MDILHPAIDRYLLDHTGGDDEAVLLEMEARAEDKGFPIVGRLCGRFLEVMARSVGARRIFEMGSGYGYSAYWFARATGPGGDIHLTDMDPANKDAALDYLQRAGLADPITYHVAGALDAFAEADGDFDVVYCDIDKRG
jgi:predicted O-methyltransferase YrrM